ncbi:MAG: YqeG family HAD IIIA-type phosphatase [Clostridia bacterium]|nr:YqeG family HAD IIIA-type phosphatase [Clostridia bacterium]
MEVNVKNGLLRPDVLFRDIYEITPDLLWIRGFRGVVFDIDNTIAPYEIEEPTEQMKAYLFSLRDRGIRIAFVSNNHGDRVRQFNRELGFTVICKAGKPFSKGTRAAIKSFGLPKSQVVSNGDQHFTDCLSAHLAGIPFYLVPPIRDKRTLLFRVKRKLEKPLLKSLTQYDAYANERSE